jgi:cytochrome c553/uncharacterized protein (DUF1499 family)
VTDFFGRLKDGGQEGFDNGKEGIVWSFPVANPDQITRIKLSPLSETGFNADRSRFCNATSDPDPVNQTFCPDPSPSPNVQLIQNTPQGCFPNQLHAAVIRGGRLYLPNICAQPEPPVRFNVNIQAVVHVVDVNAGLEAADRHVNLNAQITTETPPAEPTTSLGRLFGNDIVAIDSWAGGNFLIVSRGGNYVLRARLVNGKLDIGVPNVVRFKTGNIPTGVVVRNGLTAYVNNEVDRSVTILDLAANQTILPDVSSSAPPEPGSFDHGVLIGKLVFFTALGVPDNGLVGTQIRDINPLASRGKQSDNAWSTCASCHPAGLADGVTWMFPDGPRQTIPLDALYSKTNGAHDTRINNWSAARDSVTDFNNNSRGVQGGCGFASDDFAVAPNTCNPLGAPAPLPAANPAIYDHGISEGASEALDLETLWAQTVRPLNLPKPAANAAAREAGAGVFEGRCASCHGGPKWTKSQVLYLDNPALDNAFAAGGIARDTGLTVTANQSVQYQDSTVDTGILKFLEDIGTFITTNPTDIEIRGAGAAIGSRSLGGLGFNVPALLSTAYHAPYFHDGAAQTLEQVLELHALEGGTIQSVLNATERTNVLAFLRALDGRTALFESDADIFKDPFRDLP